MASAESNGVVPLLDLDEAAKVGVACGMREEMTRINFYRMLLNSPPCGRVENEINDRILWEGALTRSPQLQRLRELAIMRIAWLTGTAYLWAHHYSPMVDKGIEGIRPDGVEDVRDWRVSTRFNDAERAALATVDEMVLDGQAGPATVAELQRHVPEASALVELVYVTAIWRAIASVMQTIRVPLEEEYELWAPDGVAP